MSATTENDWRCLYCRRPLAQGEDCLQPDCVDARIAARKRMSARGFPYGQARPGDSE